MSEFIESIAQHCSEQDGFCHPDWEAIEKYISVQFPKEEWHARFTEAALHWAQRVGEKSSGEFYLHQTDHFILLSPEPEEKAVAMGKVCEAARTSILTCLNGIAKDWGYGKCVVFMFADEQDYYRYISHFHKDGEHAFSGGMFLQHGGYAHLAFARQHRPQYRPVILHELTHCMVRHLPLPGWLNEALAMTMEGRSLELNTEWVDRHRAYWNEQTIQEFWAGATFDQPEAQELSYHLPQILLRKLQDELHPTELQMAVFVNVAHYADAGEEAFWRVFDLSLGDLVEDFLGPGDWSPHPEQWVFTSP
jgi:hypothetical protein